ncbi:MAG: nucleoside triphosphate pyrophosphohydrolase [Myxococcales bacterium]|nr:MAG: nucleoside triphosphate pyrophosphohydrolase [Myxococcales bacterium]
MARLRDPGGCPWDREQSFATIKDYFLEEAYELLDAVETGDAEAMREELGDVLFEACFLSRIAEEQGLFDVYDAIGAIVEKLVRRHPHVFGEEKVTEASEVPGRWAKLKAQEAKHKARASILDGVPKSLPTLLQALRISERAVNVGFEWETVHDVLVKLDEEIGELKAAMARGEPQERLEDELGDMLFTMVNVGRKLGVSPHDALRRTLEKFRRRFGRIEAWLRENGEKLDEAGLERLEALWQAAKTEENDKTQ